MNSGARTRRETHDRIAIGCCSTQLRLGFTLGIECVVQTQHRRFTHPTLDCSDRIRGLSGNLAGQFKCFGKQSLILDTTCDQTNALGLSPTDRTPTKREIQCALLPDQPR